MSQLIVFARPGAALVSGFVKEISKNMAVIENNLWLPVSKKSERRRIRISFDNDQIEKMRLAKEAFIFATVSDADPALNIVLTGGETSDTTYNAHGYTVRFNGAFKFSATDTQKETNVFVGKVSDIKRNNYNNMACSTFKVNYMARKEPVSLNIGAWNRPAEQIKEGKFAIVCEAPQKTSFGLQYLARRVVSC